MGLKDTLKEASDAWDWWRRQVLRVTMIGGIVIGVFLIEAPAEIRDEFPIHKEFGIGIIVFCVVFLIALSGKGGLASRAKNLLVGTMSTGLGGLLVFGGYSSIQKGVDWKALGLGLLGVLIVFYGLSCLLGVLTGAPSPDEEDFG